MSDLSWLSDLLGSSFFRIVLIVLAVQGTLWVLRKRNPPGKTRNREWLKKRLEKERFGIWLFADFFIFLFFASTLVFAAYWFSELFPLVFVLEGVDYFFPKNASLLPAGFAALTATWFFWFPVCKLIHKKKYRKYLLYNYAVYGYDYKKAQRWLIVPLLTITLFFSVLMSRTYFAIDGNELIDQRVLSVTPDRYDLRKLEYFFIVNKSVAPNGNVVASPHVFLVFADGQTWSSRSNMATPKGEEFLELVRMIFEKTGKPQLDVDFDPVP